MLNKDFTLCKAIIENWKNGNKTTARDKILTLRGKRKALIVFYLSSSNRKTITILDKDNAYHFENWLENVLN